MINKETLKGLNNAGLARELKKVLKANFKGVKFSVTSSIYSITVQFDETQANINEVKEITGHFAAVSSDTIYVNNRISHYSDTKEYKEQQQREYEEKQAEYERIRQERESLYNSYVTVEGVHNAKVIDVKDKNIFVKALEPSVNKNDWKVDNDKYIDESGYLNKYQITDIVILNESEYNYFCFNLLNGYDFLQNRGGWTQDEQGNLLHYYAVAVTCEGKETLIIDPSGHDYARYCNRLIEDINGDLQKAIDNTIIINDEAFNNKMNSIIDNKLYEVRINKEFITKDERIIYCDYLGITAVTGKALKELIFENTGVNASNIKELKQSIEIFTECILKTELGYVVTIMGNKSSLDDIKFSERLEKELKRANTTNPTPDPEKPTKKVKSETEPQENKSNIIDLMTYKSTKPAITVSNTWSEDTATSKQLYALYCITKIKTTNLKITKGQASDLISRAKQGQDIKEELKGLLKQVKAL